MAYDSSYWWSVRRYESYESSTYKRQVASAEGVKKVVYKEMGLRPAAYFERSSTLKLQQNCEKDQSVP